MLLEKVGGLGSLDDFSMFFLFYFGGLVLGRNFHCNPVLRETLP